MGYKCFLHLFTYLYYIDSRLEGYIYHLLLLCFVRNQDDDSTQEKNNKEEYKRIMVHFKRENYSVIL